MTFLPIWKGGEIERIVPVASIEQVRRVQHKSAQEVYEELRDKTCNFLQDGSAPMIDGVRYMRTAGVGPFADVQTINGATVSCAAFQPIWRKWIESRRETIIVAHQAKIDNEKCIVTVRGLGEYVTAQSIEEIYAILVPQ